MRAVVLIDGGYLRVRARKADREYTPQFITAFARATLHADEVMLRALYYDCAPYNGSVKKPISGTSRKFTGTDSWMNTLASEDLFAVRRGVLKFRGWVPKSRVSSPPVDTDFSPKFEQKGVDMKIGLDVAAYSYGRLVERIILVSNDTDCVPALKMARKNGLQTVVAYPEGASVAAELRYHADFIRSVEFP